MRGNRTDMASLFISFFFIYLACQISRGTSLCYAFIYAIMMAVADVFVSQLHYLYFLGTLSICPWLILLTTGYFPVSIRWIPIYCADLEPRNLIP